MGHRPELVGGGLLRSAGGWSALKAIRNSGMRIMGDERILGGSDFVESVLEKANEEYEKRTIATAKGFSLEKILDIVAGYFDLDSNIWALPGRRRRVARARSIFCVLAIDLFGYSGAEVGC
jgi:chromosomal replication initiation ATPase DnaA